MNILIVGASGGIGQALCATWAARGARIFGTSRTPRPDSDGVTWLTADLEDVDSISALADHLQSRVDRLHRVYTVAGLLHDGPELQPERRLEHLDAANLHRLFAVNAVGPTLLVRHLLPLLKGPDTTRVVQLSARVGSIDDNRLGGWYGYRATKAAQNQFTKTLSIELRRRAPNVALVAYHPGTVDTGLSKPFQRGVPPHKLHTARRAADDLIRVTESVEPANSGCFVDWAGASVAW